MSENEARNLYIGEVITDETKMGKIIEKYRSFLLVEWIDHDRSYCSMFYSTDFDKFRRVQ